MHESNELAEDSGDDKKIRKAQNNAARKEEQLLQTKSRRQRTSPSSFTMVQSRIVRFFEVIVCRSLVFFPL